MEQVSRIISQELEFVAGIPSADSIIRSKRKAISSLFPYAARLARDGQQRMINAICRVASKSKYGVFTWDRIGPYIASWFDDSSPSALNQAISIASPSAGWIDGSYTQGAVARWSAATLETSYSETVGQNVVDTLLQIAYKDSLRPHIPIEILVWLKRRPSLLPNCQGQFYGTATPVVRYIRRFGDIELLKPYLLLVWSEWNPLHHAGDTTMRFTIREKFCGIEMWGHREDPTQRLDRVLGQLDRGLEYFTEHDPHIREDHIADTRINYAQLKETLAELDREAMKTLSRAPSNLTLFDENLLLTVVCRISPDRHLCPAPSCSVISYLHQAEIYIPLFPHHFTYQGGIIP